MSTYKYSFSSHSFYLNGRTLTLNVLPKTNHPAGGVYSQSYTSFTFDDTHALRVKLDLSDPTNPQLSITTVSNPDLADHKTEFMPLTYTEAHDPNGLYGATSLGISYLTSEDNPPSIQRLVLGGLGITYIEATDPTFMKVFQFGTEAEVYLKLGGDQPGEMDFLQVSWI